MSRRHIGVLAAAGMVGWLLAATAVGEAADWPAWRADARRSAATDEALPATLSLHWQRDLKPLTPAWPDEPRMTFDHAYQPVVLGDLLFVGSSRDDTVRAYDTDTGAERWVFHAEGPVRFAPMAWRGPDEAARLFVTSDDGHLYCLAADTGKLLWKVRGGPSDRKVLGNGRLISMWPARGAPVAADGTVYFAAGIWPFMGVFIHAVEADSGRLIWTNSGLGSLWTVQPHASPAFAGLAPQGYLAVAGDKLLVPNGRAVPAALDRRTGQLLYFPLHSGVNHKHGDSFVAADDTCFVNDGWVYELATGRCMVTTDHHRPVLADQALYSLAGAFSTRDPEVLNLKDRQGRPYQRWRLAPLWAMPELDEAALWLKAGGRLYLSRGTRLYWTVPPTAEDPATLRYLCDLGGTPGAVIVADGRLFAVTLEGQLSCYGVGKAQPVFYAPPAAPPPGAEGTEGDGAAARTAPALLRQTGIREGYALVLGLRDGALVEALVRASDLHVIAVDGDPGRVAAVRRRMEKAGLYGTRAVVHLGDPLDFGWPSYLASLVTSEDGTKAAADRGRAFAETVFGVLRPYGGAACLPLQAAEREAFATAVREGALPKARLRTVTLVERNDALLLAREGALPGAADWTHQYADAANTAVSQDALVKAPLEMLWFGGSSNRTILPRHGHGPTPQAVGGRLFVQGPDSLRAMDVYTGRVLWERAIPRLGQYYDTTLHQPGANAIGSNYVSMPDALYVMLPDRCLRLDPATGRTVREFRLPTHAREGSATWSFITAADDLLLAATAPQDFWDPDFRPEEFRDRTPEDLQLLADQVRWLRAFRRTRLLEPLPEETQGEFLARNLNALLVESRLLERLPEPVSDDLRLIQERIDGYVRPKPDNWRGDQRLRGMNRHLLETANRTLPRNEWDKPGGLNWTATSSERLVAMDRHSGEVLWTRRATAGFRHNAIALTRGRVFVIDRVPEPPGRVERWRDRLAGTSATLLALEARTGRVLWQTQEGVFGTWLGYSAAHDLLLQARRPSRDMLDEPGERMSVLRGADGAVVWDRPVTYRGPCLLHGEMIITQDGAFDLRTGEPRMRQHPLTGLPIPWTYQRMYGCGSVIGSRHLLTFRSAAAGYYDLLADAGTGNFGGFRSGCTNNLIPAGGVLLAPDYTRTCTCSYHNQTSLALVPARLRRKPGDGMPGLQSPSGESRPMLSPDFPEGEVETWSFTSLEGGEGPIRRMGLNLGAPGDRLAADGTLWLEFPFVGGPTPRVPVSTAPATPDTFRLHMTAVESPALPWVAASGLVGIERISVTMEVFADPASVPTDAPTDPASASRPPVRRPAAPRTFTVRLHFLEPEDRRPGERVFDVSAQGRTVVKDLDVAAEAGGPRRGLVKEVTGVEVVNDLIITLTACPSSKAPPLMCGLEAFESPPAAR